MSERMGERMGELRMSERVTERVSKRTSERMINDVKWKKQHFSGVYIDFCIVAVTLLLPCCDGVVAMFPHCKYGGSRKLL